MKSPETHAEYIAQARAIESSNDILFTKLAILSSFTATFLKPYIIVESDKIGRPLKPWFGPFNQFEQMVFDKNSELWNQQPDIIWIALRIEDIDRYLVNEFASIGAEAARTRISSLRERLLSLAKSARSCFSGPILISNFILSDQGGQDIFDVSNPDGLTYLVMEQNQRLAKELSEINDTYLFDYASCVHAVGRSSWKDPRLWYMARVAVGPSAQKHLASNLARTAIALLRPPAKCLILDLDNTLWGGVLGDDGPAGIKLGDDYPGNVYKDFQAALLALRHRGFILAIASKNDNELVRQTLDTHPEMILRTKHFAEIRANWDSKPVNLRHIAESLNIGLDSLVFIDDNPVERAQVQSELPMVHVIELPSDPLGYMAALKETAAFDRPRLLREDSLRADMYQNEARRKEHLGGNTDVREFIAQLDMTAEAGLLNSNTIERIHQLINKTNQFNLTTRRYLLEEIQCLADSNNSNVAWLRLADRFGELGLVCVGIIRRINEEVWEIDTFLMSCRVMGRNVEDAFLSYLAELASAGGATLLRGIYIKTPKSKPVETFYPDRHFTKIDHPDEVTWKYESPLTNDAFKWPEHIKRQDA